MRSGPIQAASRQIETSLSITRLLIQIPPAQDYAELNLAMAFRHIERCDNSMPEPNDQLISLGGDWVLMNQGRQWGCEGLLPAWVDLAGEAARGITPTSQVLGHRPLFGDSCKLRPPGATTASRRLGAMLSMFPYLSGRR
jgi:hypothetical protein